MHVERPGLPSIAQAAPVTPPAGRGHRDQTGAPAPSAETGAAGLARAAMTVTSPLAADTLSHLAAAAQEEGGDAAKPPPAQAARAALEGRPDLAGLPFGRIVSALARGEALPEPPPAAPTSEPDPDAGAAATPDALADAQAIVTAEPPPENAANGATAADELPSPQLAVDGADVEEILVQVVSDSLA